MVKIKNHRNGMCLVVLFFTFFGVKAQLDTSFVKVYGSPEYDAFHDIKSSNLGGYIMVGVTGVFEENRKSDAYLVKSDEFGNVIWSVAFGGAEIDVAEAVIELNNGDIMIAGYSNSFGGDDYNVFVALFGFDGSYKWVRTFGGQQWDFAYDLIETADDNFMICGKTFHPVRGDEQGLVIKFNLNGDIVWSQSWGDVGDDAFYSCTSTMSGLIYLAGYKSTETKMKDFWVVETDIEGELRWDGTYGRDSDDVAYSIIETIDNKLAIVGYLSSSSAGKDGWLIKTEPRSNIIWNFYMAEPNEDVFTSVFQIGNDLGVVGYSNSVGLGKDDGFLYGVGNDSSFLYGTSFGGTEIDKAFKGIASNQLGSVYVGTTNTFGNGWYDAMFVRTKQNGETVLTVDDTIATIPNMVTSSELIEIVDENDISIYPNPVRAGEQISIQTKKYINYEYNIYSIDGRLIKSGKSNSIHTLTAPEANQIIIEIIYENQNRVNRVTRVISVLN
jgi:hypothetical protein